MFSHQSRVRYSDVDRMNIVYHAQYLNYWEWARTEWLRSLGKDYFSLEESGLLLPVIDLKISFHKPANYDDLISTYITIEDISKIKIVLKHESFRERDLLVSGSTTHLASDKQLKISKKFDLKSFFERE